jgi:hypothetical protein
MHIQPRNHFRRSQHHRQLQFCVPLMALKGASYRIKHTAIESLPSVDADRQADSTP